MLAIAGFAGAVALGLLAIGPWAMDLLFDDGASYGRGAWRSSRSPWAST